MLSRVAERLYWLARYIERAENTARLLLVRHQLILDLPKTIQPGWELLTDVLGTREIFDEQPGSATEKNIIAFVFGDRANHSSILSSLNNARENIRTAREVTPAETWERVNSLYLSVAHRRNSGLPRNARHKILNDIVQRCQQITGMLAGCMNHEYGYHFIRIGRNLERADMSTRIIDVGSARLMGDAEEILPYRNVLWISVLKSLSAYQMYRLSVKRNVQPDDVLEFLLQSEVFPRALAHTLNEIESSILTLPHNEQAAKIVNQVKRKLARTKTEDLRNQELHEFIDEMQLLLDKIHTKVAESWFAHSVSQ